MQGAEQLAPSGCVTSESVKSAVWSLVVSMAWLVALVLHVTGSGRRGEGFWFFTALAVVCVLGFAVQGRQWSASHRESEPR
jgi:hypothetical protein